MRIRNFAFGLVLLGAVLSLFNCIGDQPEDELKDLELMLQNSYVKTHQFVAIEVNTELIYDSYIGYFGIETIDLYAVNDNFLFFVVPDVSPGNYELSIESFSQTFSFDVETTKVPDNPTEVVNNLMNMPLYKKVLKETDSLVNIGLIPSDDRLYQDLLVAEDSVNALRARFESLSIDQQKSISTYIAANQDVINEYNNIMDGVYEDGTFKKGYCNYDKYKQKKQLVGCLLREMARGVFIMCGPSIVGGLAVGEATLGSGTVLGAILGAGIAEKVGGWFGYPIVTIGRNRFRNAWFRLCNLAFIPADQLNDELSASKRELSFYNGAETLFNYEFDVRNVQKEDEGEEELSSLSTLIRVFNKTSEVLGYQTINYAAKKTERERIESFENSNIIINENNDVSGVVVNDNGVFKLMFSTENAVPQEFSFSLKFTYNDEEFVSSSFDATLLEARGEINISAVSEEYIVAFKDSDFNGVAWSMGKYEFNITGKISLTGTTSSLDFILSGLKAYYGENFSFSPSESTISINPIDSTFSFPIEFWSNDDYADGMVKTMRIEYSNWGPDPLKGELNIVTPEIRIRFVKT